MGVTNVVIREATEQDAKRLAELIKHVENKSDFLMYESGERVLTEEKQRKMIQSLSAQSNSVIMVAEEEGQLIGYLLVIGGEAKRTQHRAYLVIGIDPAYQGKGVGSKLFNELENWAGEHAIHRLELTVVADNVADLRLYKKFGFEIEGTKQDSLVINGEYYDEFYMAKLL